MPLLPISEAEKLVPVGKSTIYEDLKNGTLSFTTNARGKRVIDTAELDRVYGLTPPETPETETGENRKAPEPSESTQITPHITTILEQQISLLQSQLDQSLAREERLLTIVEQAQGNLTTEQNRNEQLMLPPGEPEKSVPRWLNYFRLRR